MKIEPDTPKLIRTRVSMVSKTPPLGKLTIETSGGTQHFAIDEESATDLLDEILSFFGVPRPDIPLRGDHR
jgi:hypothetical protein